VVNALDVVEDIEATTILAPGVTILPVVLVGGSFNTAAGSATTGSIRSNAASFFSGTTCPVSTGPVSPAKTAAQIVANGPTGPCTTASAGTATLGAWAPNPNGPVNAIAAPGPIGELNLSSPQQSSPVYLAGNFTTVGGQAVSDVGEFGISGTDGAGSVTTTAPASQEGVIWAASPAAQAPSTTWHPALAGPAPVSATALALGSDGNVYAGGNFTSVNGVIRHRVVQLAPNTSATSTATAGSWDPNAGNVVNALATAGSSILVGGQFLVLGGATFGNVADMDSTGTVNPAFSPNTDGPVNAITAANGIVYLGGSFSHIGGTSSPFLGAVMANGSVDGGFIPASNGIVDALSVNNTTLYAGGAFSSIGGASQNGLAALDPATGTANPWSPALAAGAVVNSLAVDGNNVYAGGTFTAGGQSDAAAFSPVTGAQTSFNPGISSGTVQSIALAPAGGPVYLGGSFTSPAGNNLIAVDSSTGTAGTWSSAVNGPVNALALSGDGTALYVGGAFTALGGAARNNLGSVLTASGLHTSFNPGSSGPVNALTLTTSGGQDTLAVGGSFVTISGYLTGGFGLF
jgi:hypothetical protein